MSLALRLRGSSLGTAVTAQLQRYRLSTAAPATAYGFTSRWTVVDGIRLHSREPVSALPGATTVVLVHGLAVSHRYLMPTAAELLAQGFDPRVVDLPGFGLSGRPVGFQGVRQHADALGGWLDAAGLGPVVLLGNSYGCQVIIDLAMRRPGRCSALVLSGPTMDIVGRTATRQVLRWLRDALRENPMQIPILLRDVREATPQRVAATLGHSLRDPVESKLPRLTVPTLVLRGGHEPIVPPRWAQQVTDLVPGARRADISGSPHNCVYAAPLGLVAAVLPFLARQAVDPQEPVGV